ncbi:MAG: LysR family transcriptional regulator [Sphingosinicella sp.]|nr:LysR family transcriptional regulator [Sphingosinicella sp.]
MDRLRQLELFAAASERLSFSGAARALGVSPASVSAAIASLEARWNVRLFDRTTRNVALTDTGRALLERSRRALREVELAESIAQSAGRQVRGPLRVSAPVSYGLRKLTPLFVDFLKQNPAVDLILDLTDRRVDLLTEGYDVAVRIGHRLAPGLVARKLAGQRLVLCAAPEYLDRYGFPDQPLDLADHRCLIFTPRTPVGRWSFAGPNRASRTVTVTGPLASDNGEVLQAAARDGLGITLAPDFLVEDDLASGALVELLPEWQPLRLGIYTVRIGGGQAPPKVRHLIEHLGRGLRERA